MRNLQIEPEHLPIKPVLSNLLADAYGAPIVTENLWKLKRTDIEKRWKSFLGLDDQFTSKIPLKLEMTLLNNVRSFSRYRLRYNIDGDGRWTGDAYLLVPTAILLKKMPAFVAFHQTTENHAKEPAGLAPGSSFNMAYGVHLAELGYVVLCPRNYLYLGQRTYSANKTTQWEKTVQEVRSRWPQWRGMSRMIYDSIRAVDVLQSFAFVDPDRIGCLGHSLGAKEVLYAAAFDDRYKVAVFSEGGIGLASKTNWDAKWYLGSDVKQIRTDCHDHHELLALMAPRPFLLLAGGSLEPWTRKGNGVDDEKSWKYIKAVMPVYELLNKPKNIGWWHHKQGHDYPEEAQKVAQKFLMAHLPPP
jgi:dienelactone hydrolase